MFCLKPFDDKSVHPYLAFMGISAFATAKTTISNGNFDRFFKSKIMQIDYVHGGNSSTESFKIFGIKNDGLWGGRVKVLNDPYNLGLYASILLGMPGWPKQGALYVCG